MTHFRILSGGPVGPGGGVIADVADAGLEALLHVELKEVSAAVVANEEIHIHAIRVILQNGDLADGNRGGILISSVLEVGKDCVVIAGKGEGELIQLHIGGIPVVFIAHKDDLVAHGPLCHLECRCV